jgi:hypothetical protein
MLQLTGRDRYRINMEGRINNLKGKYCEEYMAQHTRGYAGVPDGIMNSTTYTRSQALWRTSKLED